MGADLKEILIPAGRLQARVAELAAEIDAYYAGRNLLLVGVLKGAVMVMADLARAMRLPVEMDWMAVSSYGSGTRSSGVVRILKDLDTDISGRDVLIVEDIVDSGLTLSWLVGNLRSRQPASLRLCVLLRKPAAARMDVDVAYIGFDIADHFVVGYGLDYAERYRNLPFIGTLAPHVYGGTGESAARAGEAAAGEGPGSAGGGAGVAAAGQGPGSAGGGAREAAGGTAAAVPQAATGQAGACAREAKPGPDA
jgi:hypoxanthine phosphoribosyltransferase